MTDRTGALSRRRVLLTGSVTAAGAVLAGCTSNTRDDNKNTGDQTKVAAGSNAKPGKTVTIGFSAPAADHGWIAAITNNAKAQAGKYPDVKFVQVAAGKDVAEQRAAVESLIQQKPDVIVLLPHDGAQMTATGRKAMDAGIPVINLDREFSEALAYRCLVKGDNYGMGVAAGNLIGQKFKNNPNAVIAEIAGIDELPHTQD